MASIPWWGSRVVADPVVRFLVAGALIFGLERAVHRPLAAQAPRHILVDDRFVRAVTRATIATTGRAVPPEEQRLLVDQAIEEEILYREAKALRLDENDSIVRRRLVQKAEFLLEDARPIEPPTEDDLRAYYEAHTDAYARPEALTFRQVLFARDERGSSAERDAQQALERLRRDPDAPVRGDPLLAGNTFVARTERDIDGLLGPGAGAAMTRLADHVWGGPIASPYGYHLVRIDERSPPSVASLHEVNAQVREAVIAGRREKNRQAARASLRRLYVVDDQTSLPPVAQASLERAR